MQASGRIDRLTGRVNGLELQADTFAEERILGALTNALRQRDVEITIECEAFYFKFGFNNGEELEDDDS